MTAPRKHLRTARADFEFALAAMKDVQFEERLNGEGVDPVRWWASNEESLKAFAEARAHVERGLLTVAAALREE